jgi:hypothetical protein
MNLIFCSKTGWTFCTETNLERELSLTIFRKMIDEQIQPVREELKRLEKELRVASGRNK